MIINYSHRLVGKSWLSFH